MLQRVRQLTSLGLLLIVSAFLLVAPVYAEDAKFQVTITGIECDLEEIYGDNDPATVVVPPYCSNAPQPEVPIIPTPAQPNPPAPTMPGFHFQPTISMEPLLYSSPAATVGLKAPARLLQPVDSYQANEKLAVSALILFAVYIIGIVILTLLSIRSGALAEKNR